MFPMKEKEVKQIIKIFDTEQIKKGQYYRVEDILSCSQYDCIVEEVTEGRVILKSIGSNKEIIILPDQERYIVNRLKLVVDNEKNDEINNKKINLNKLLTEKQNDNETKNKKQIQNGKEVNQQYFKDFEKILKQLFYQWNL